MREHQKIAEGRWERPKPPEPLPVLETFGDYATTWLATLHLKPKTREGYEHLLPAFGACPIVGIAPVDVRKWLVDNAEGVEFRSVE